MAKYRISTPDGSTYEVTAPDDATQEQVLAYAQAHHADQSSPMGGDKVSDRSLSDLVTGRTPKPKAYANDLGGTVMGAADALQHHIVNAPLGLA